MGLHNHRLVLLRHGETAWSKSGQHTGRTDIELTDTGRVQAELAGRVLRELNLTDPLVISSPRIRALTTAKLAGLSVDEVSPLLAEWDYGDYEGLTAPKFMKRIPIGWSGPTGVPAARVWRKSATAPTGPSPWRWST
jgi:probable phosphoglycerate mutase